MYLFIACFYLFIYCILIALSVVSSKYMMLNVVPRIFCCCWVIVFPMIFSKGRCWEDGVYRPEHLCERPQHEWERLHISTPIPGQNAWCLCLLSFSTVHLLYDGLLTHKSGSNVCISLVFLEEIRASRAIVTGGRLLVPSGIYSAWLSFLAQWLMMCGSCPFHEA